MREPPDIGRRGVLTGAFLTKQGREELLRSQLPLGPFPPELKVSSEACTQCDNECVKACPEEIIYLHPETHSLASMPYLDFSVSGCTYCGECSDACPSSSNTKHKHITIGKLSIILDKCLSFNGVFCITCVGKCSFGALALDERRRLRYTRGSCTGCGMCIGVCPVNALKVQSIEQ